MFFEHLLQIECEMFPAGSSIRNTGLELSSSSLEGCGVFRRQTFAQGMEELSSGIVGLLSDSLDLLPATLCVPTVEPSILAGSESFSLTEYAHSLCTPTLS